jgi:hypothetical protein
MSVLATMQNMVQIQIMSSFFVFHYTNGDQEDLSIFLYEPIGSCMGNDENLKRLLKEKSVLSFVLSFVFVYGKIGDLP